MPAQGKNRVILGLMTFGPHTDKGARITKMEDYKSCLNVFHNAGYDEIDTARVYVGGEQESWTASALEKPEDAQKFKIATKWYPNKHGDHRAETLKAKVEESLTALKRDKVDIFYLHAADRGTPFQETLKAIDDMHKAGKFDTFAISNFTSAEVAEVCLTAKYNGWVRPTLYQGMYNAITRMAESELLPTLRRFGLDYVCYNPIAGGILSGKIKSGEIPTEGRFSDTAASGAMYRQRYFKDNTFNALKVIEEAVAKHEGLTIIEIAFRWLVHHSQLRLAQSSPSGNDGIIIGVSSQEQLEANLKNLEKGPLPEDVVAALDEAWKIIGGTAPNYYHLKNEYGYDTLEALYGEGAL